MTAVNGSVTRMTEEEARVKVLAYENQVEPWKYGVISKSDANRVYASMKNGTIKVLPETTSMLYDMTKADIRMADARYSQDHTFYDRVIFLQTALANKDYDVAQAFINLIEENEIKLAGKKSRFFKYQK